MTVEYGNGWYFFYLIFAAAVIAALYFSLRKLSPKTQKIVIIVIAFLNLAFHFLKFFGEVYYGTVKGYRELFFITLCSTTIAFAPFAYLSNSKAWKDYIFYIGVAGGLAALFIPTEALGGDPFCFLSIRFYVQHTVLAALPLVSAMLNLHRPSYKNIWKMPFIALFAYMFIIVNHMVAYEAGFMKMEEGFMNARFFNPSLVWGPTDPLANALKTFTPNVFKKVTVGEYAGQEKYLPLLWITPAIFLIMLVMPVVYCLLFDRKNVFGDAIRLKCKLVLRDNYNLVYQREERID